MDTKLEDSNLALIGSDQDKAAKQAAANCEVNWKGAGQKVGIQIWRVENKRDEHDNPVFGINSWPESRYGEFYNGDSYIVLETKQGEDKEKLEWDIYFWIGSESSQDEYGVAAYKANELDDFLGTEPVQHREIEGRESAEFLRCFPRGIRIMDGGIDGGFRNVGADSNEEDLANLPKRLFHCRMSGRKPPVSKQVPTSCDSLNHGDTFILDAGKSIFTWFGKDCSPFEKNKAAAVARKICSSRYGHAILYEDIQEDDEAGSEFWEFLGGKGKIAEADEYKEPEAEKRPATMFMVSDDDRAKITITEVPVAKENLDSGNVMFIDAGERVYIWVGKGASKREKSQSMVIVDEHLRSLERDRTTDILRVLEGQESRCKTFDTLFAQ